MSRHLENRMRRVEQTMAPPPAGERRVFRLIVDEDEAEAEISRFQAENGVADNDLLIARIIVDRRSEMQA